MPYCCVCRRNFCLDQTSLPLSTLTLHCKMEEGSALRILVDLAFPQSLKRRPPHGIPLSYPPFSFLLPLPVHPFEPRGKDNGRKDTTPRSHSASLGELYLFTECVSNSLLTLVTLYANKLTSKQTKDLHYCCSERNTCTRNSVATKNLAFLGDAFLTVFPPLYPFFSAI